MKIDEKIYRLGLAVMDEMLLHKNVSKETTVSIEDSTALRDMIVYVGPHGIFTFDEEEIANFYNVWAEYFMNPTLRRKHF